MRKSIIFFIFNSISLFSIQPCIFQYYFKYISFIQISIFQILCYFIIIKDFINKIENRFEQTLSEIWSLDERETEGLRALVDERTGR